MSLFRHKKIEIQESTKPNKPLLSCYECILAQKLLKSQTDKSTLCGGSTARKGEKKNGYVLGADKLWNSYRCYTMA